MHSLPLANGETVGMEFDSDDKDDNCNLDCDIRSERVAWSMDTTLLHFVVVIMICQIETQMCKL